MPIGKGKAGDYVSQSFEFACSLNERSPKWDQSTLNWSKVITDTALRNSEKEYKTHGWPPNGFTVSCIPFVLPAIRHTAES